MMDVGFNYYLMVRVEWKGKEFIFKNLKFIVRLICLKVKWEFENLRMNKNVYLWDFEMVKILVHAGLSPRARW